VALLSYWSVVDRMWSLGHDPVMDPITLVVTAVALGASAGLTDTAAQVVRDAYAKLKTLLTGRAVDVSGVERKPGSDAQQAALAETLTDAGDVVDADVLAAARSVTEAVAAAEPAAAAAIGVDLERIRAEFLRIASVDAAGTAVRVRDGEFTGGIDIGQVRAGFEGGGHPPTR
jgi:hypothetical protein